MVNNLFPSCDSRRLIKCLALFCFVTALVSLVAVGHSYVHGRVVLFFLWLSLAVLWFMVSRLWWDY